MQKNQQIRKSSKTQYQLNPCDINDENIRDHINPIHTGGGTDLPNNFYFFVYLKNFSPQHMMKLYVNSYFILTKTLIIYFGQKNY